MKLDEYVKQTLLDITNGVAEAQSESQLFIAPGRIDQDSVTSPQMVSFEVMVTVEAEGAGSIKVLSLAEVGGPANRAYTQKVSFEVPVYFQLQTERHPRGRVHFTEAEAEKSS